MEMPKEDLDKIGKFPVRVFVVGEQDLHEKGGYLCDKALEFVKEHQKKCGISQFVMIRSFCCVWFNFELFCPRCLKIEDMTNALCEPSSCEYNEAIFGNRKVVRVNDETENKATVNGYAMDEVVSALQKEIRRGNEENAAFWACELLDSGVEWRVWRRLKVIAAEDVGCGDPAAVANVAAMEESFYKLGLKGDDARLFPVLATIYLARCKKDRTADDMTCYLQERRKDGMRLEIPAYAVDCHTMKGRQMGKGEKEFWSIGSVLTNESPSYNKVYLEYFKKKFDLHGRAKR